LSFNHGFGERFNRQPLSVAAPKKMVTQHKTFYKYFFMYTLQELAFLEFFLMLRKTIDTTYDTMYNVNKEGFKLSKWDKLLAKICSLSKDLRFDELRKVLESYGYEMVAPKSGSSHYTFRKPGCQPITIPKHTPIKKVYVELVKQVVESEANNNENAE
jgi:predicted RNA binding protein YcfA (HicA-like mRNA interferase family)